MPITARKHFDEDITRARAILDHASNRREGLKEDLFRAAWVFAVGALDAYLCDAYVDVLSRQLRAFAKRDIKRLLGAYRQVKLPAEEVLTIGHYPSRGYWALRMSARRIMEKENMLKLGRVKERFNPALPQGRKLWNDVIGDWILKDNLEGLYGYSSSSYRSMSAGDKEKARKRASEKMIHSLGKLVDRRNKISHDCDRPREAIGPITPASARKSLRYVTTFVQNLDTHLEEHATA